VDVGTVDTLDRRSDHLQRTIPDIFMSDPNPTLRLMRSTGAVDYPAAVRFMEREANLIANGDQPELIWFLEHPPLLTKGTRGRAEHLVDAGRFPVFETDRGGEITYHGPGQRIVYTLLDVRRRADGDVRAFVRLLERCVIGALDRLGVTATSDPARPGVWVHRADLPGGEAKIGALGLKVRRGVSLHGISLNVDPDLSHFATIVACGLEGSAITSLAALGAIADFESVDNALIASFTEYLGPLTAVPDPEVGAADTGLTP
jgi:lipoyl(octanoyl) transferase